MQPWLHEIRDKSSDISATRTTLPFFCTIVRMSRGILFAQFGHRGVGINRSGHDTFVPEQPADGLELRSVTEHGGGETMTKHVGGFLLLTGDCRKRCAHDVAKCRVTESLNAQTQKKCAFVN